MSRRMAMGETPHTERSGREEKVWLGKTYSLPMSADVNEFSAPITAIIMKSSATLRTLPSSRSKQLKTLLLGLGLASAGIQAQAVVLTSLAGSFPFGPGALDFTQGASLASYSGPGTLLGVRVELSGNVTCVLFATNNRNVAGTVDYMTEDVAFAIAGLPFASLSSAIPTYFVPSFILAANSTRTFNVVGTAPVAFVNLTAPASLAFYDSGMGAPAFLPFQFRTAETFTLSKAGSDISGGSTAVGQGLVKVYYTVDEPSIVPVNPVPEVSTAVSAGCFAILGTLVLVRGRRNLLSRPGGSAEQCPSKPDSRCN